MSDLEDGFELDRGELAEGCRGRKSRSRSRRVHSEWAWPQSGGSNTLDHTGVETRSSHGGTSRLLRRVQKRQGENVEDVAAETGGDRDGWHVLTGEGTDFPA